MNRRAVLALIIVVCLLIVGTIFSKSSTKSPEVNTATTTGESLATSIPVVPADKVEVVHFHSTQQCASCIAVGKLAKQTIEEKFPEEVKSGKIVFKEINGELPENEAIVMKYRASGSSLFVNAIRGDKDDITEDVTVWRLVNSESQYISYFENKLNTLLGK